MSYCERFYNRQFITREKSNHQILEHLEMLLKAYFQNRDLASKGLPTVQDVAEKLNVSSSYLGTLLRTQAGQSTAIHSQQIDRESQRKAVNNKFIYWRNCLRIGF